MTIEAIACKTRSGSKIHVAISPGSSCTDCGVWLKANAIHFKVRGKVYKKHLCEKCFGTLRTEVIPQLNIEVVDIA